VIEEIIVDTFAGGGGASDGISQALGREVDVAINHDEAAIRMHEANHPKTKHYIEDVWKAAPRMVTGGRPVGLLWASPDCKHFSRAKGGKPVSKNIRSLAWVVCRWAAEAQPRIIILENVREFADWGPLVPRWACADCPWKGTEGQAKLAQPRHRRRCPECESSRLSEEAGTLIPDPKRKGLTFRRFTGRLRNLGYEVDHKVLNAADYGAPTHRRRLFLVARRDGKAIRWPEPTHGDPKKLKDDMLGLKPYRTAAECIDWTLPCPSIFDRKKPLADATLRRIAHGIKRYVLDNPKPFIVGRGGPEYSGKPRDVERPLGTVVQENHSAVVVPHLTPLTHQGERKGSAPGEPLPTVTGAHRGEQAIVASTLIRYNGEKEDQDGAHVHGIEEPLKTIPTENRFGLIAATMVQTGYGERDGQAPRALNLEKPMGAAVSGACKQGLVAAMLAKHYGGRNPVDGQSVDKPLSTVTTQDHHALIAANLVHLNHGGKQDSSVEEPLRTVMAGGGHAALVYSFLVKYFGTAIGQAVDAPLGTNTTKDRFGLIVVHIDGEPYVIVDIGMRMLEPRELARGQSFRDDYILTGTKTSQVARIGNSVPPLVAKAMVQANYY
jgi:DNA (cytosine-5)-methyltransferase 1